MPADTTVQSIGTTTNRRKPSSPAKNKRLKCRKTHSRHTVKFSFIPSWESIINVIKRRRAENSPVKHFMMLIYILYLRYSSEFGITLMTWPEAVIVNTIFAFLLFAVINQGSRLIFDSIVFMIRFARCMFWVYTHMDKYPQY